MAPTEPTEEQLHAIATIGQDMPVTAGAGSGKTFVLTHRYLQILAEKQADLDEILTITFTEKAANQMKKKIRDLITRFARGEHDGEFPPVMKDDMLFPGREYWQNLLDSFERTYISTIHGFCSRILREQAVQIGLDPEFRVMDDHTMTLQRPEIIRRTIFRLIRHKSPAIDHWLNRYSLHQIIRTMNGLVAGRSEYQGLQTFYSVEDPDTDLVQRDLYRRNRQLYISKIEPILESLSENTEWRHISSTIRQMVPLDTTDKFYPHYEKLKPAAELLDRAHDPVEQISAWIVIAENLMSKGAKGNWEGVNHTEFKSEMKSFRDEILNPEISGITLFDEQVEKEAIALAMSGARLFEKVLTAYQDWKEQRGYVDYDDLLIKAVELLRDYPEIRKEYASQFRHILLDEFQDTNPIQFELVNLLHKAVDEEDEHPNRLFVVGDPKQSIYRFRGTEVSLFNQAKEDLAVPDAALSMSFRSQPGLLKWVDALFEVVMGIREDGAEIHDYEQHYAALTPHRDDIQQSPHVSVNLVETGTGSEEDDAGTRAQLEAAYVARWLADTLPGIQVEDQGEFRQAVYGDVAILFRRTTYLKQFEYALNLAGIPSYTAGGSGFFEKQEIVDLLNILQVLTHPEDEITCAGILRSALFGVSDEGLLRLSGVNRYFRDIIFTRDIAIPDKLSEEDLRGLNTARAKMQQWKALKDRMNPGRLVDAICTETGYPGIISTGKDGLQKLRNVEQFIELAYEFGRNSSTSLARFVEYIRSLREMSDQEEATLFEDEHNAVQLMTIHKSKGLEFPVVIIPQIDARPASYQPQRDFYQEFGWALSWNDLDKPAGEQASKPFLYTYLSNLERSKELAESKRLFYVANTRARDHLMLSGVVNKKGGIEAFMGALDISKDNWLHWTLYVLAKAGWQNESGIVDMDNGAEVVVHVQEHSDDSSLPAAADILEGIESREEVTERYEKVLSAAEINRRWKPEKVADTVEELNPTLIRLLMDSETDTGSTDEVKKQRVQRSEPESSSDPIAGAEFGSIAHKLFEKFLSGTKLSNEKLIDSILKNNNSGKIEQTKDALLDILDRFEKSTLCQTLQESEYFTEIPFLASINSVPLSGKIDLLVKSPGGNYTIVDFKSDAISENEIDETAAHYRPQLLAYVYGVSQATGKLPEAAQLYFMRLGQTKSVDFSQQDLEDLEEKIQTLISN